MAGQIIRKGEKRWLVRIFMGRDAKGKRDYFNKVIHGTKKKATSYLSRTLTDISMGTFVAPSTDTLDEYLDKWLKNSAKHKLSARTFTHQGFCLDRYVRPELGNKKLASLQPLDLQELYTGLQERGLGPRTVQIVHNILNRAFNQGVKWRVMAFNPAQLVDKPKQQRREMQALAPEEASRFLQAARGDLYFLYFALALETGARPSELSWVTVERSRI